MTPYRTIITVDNPSEIVLTNVPVEAGDRVEVVVRKSCNERVAAVERMKKLLSETQALPQLQSITDDVIAAEIAAYRNGQ